MTEAPADNEQSGRFERPERRVIDPTVKYALDFVKASEDRQDRRLADAEARADVRHKELVATLGTVATRMGTHADAQRVILALIALVVLMALLLAAVRGVAVGEVGKAAGGVVGGIVGGAS